MMALRFKEFLMFSVQISKDHGAAFFLLLLVLSEFFFYFLQLSFQFLHARFCLKVVDNSN
jgi:hypothetical protein